MAGSESPPKTFRAQCASVQGPLLEQRKFPGVISEGPGSCGGMGGGGGGC